MFEVIFLKGEYCYRYGFRYNLERIVDEWLFRKTTPRSKEQMLFVRNEEGICVEENNFPEGVGYEEKPMTTACSCPCVNSWEEKCHVRLFPGSNQILT